MGSLDDGEKIGGLGRPRELEGYRGLEIGIVDLDFAPKQYRNRRWVALLHQPGKLSAIPIRKTAIDDDDGRRSGFIGRRQGIFATPGSDHVECVLNTEWVNRAMQTLGHSLFLADYDYHRLPVGNPYLLHSVVYRGRHLRRNPTH